jgi:iron complex outermembrane receptor protein
LAAWSLLASAQVASAQEVAPECALRLWGQALDAEGKPIPGAQVRLYSEQEPPERATKTDPQGQYAFEALCAGRYEARVEAQGFVPVGEDLWLDQATRQDWRLSPRPSLDVEVRAKPTQGGDPAPRESLQDEALDRTRGLSLGEALKNINGVRAIETGTVSKPVIHGMSGSRLVTLHDGVRHESQSWGLDHAPEIDPFAAHRLTVVKGAAGVRYGPEAIGGVILVEPPRLPRDPGLWGEAHAVGGWDGRLAAGSATLLGGAEALPGLGWRLQASAKDAGSISTPDYPLDNTALREWSLSAALGYHRPNHGLELASSWFDSSFGVFTGQISENSNQFIDLIERGRPLGVERYRADRDVERPYQDVAHTTSKLEGYVAGPSLGKLSARLSYQQDWRQEYDKVPRYIEGPQLDFDLSTSTADLLWEFDLGDALASVGAVGSTQANIYKGRRLIPNYRSWSAGSFALVQYPLGAWELEAGARLDQELIDTFQRERTGGDSAGVEEASLSFTTPSLALGASWAPDEDTSLGVSFAVASRAPSINELFIDGVSQGLAAFERGDLGLGPERSAGLSLDGGWAWGPWLDLRATLYAQHISGFIYLAPALDAQGEPEVALTVQGGFPSFEWLQTDALFYGADLDLALCPWPWLEARTRASTVRASDLTRDQPLVFIPPDSLEQGLSLRAARWGFLEDLSLGARWVYTARQDRVDPAADFAPPPPGYALLHAELGAAWSYSDQGKLGFALEGRNVLGQRYRNYLSRLRYFSDEQGANYFLRVKATF